MTTELKIKDLVIDDEYGVITDSATIVETAKKMKELNVPDLVVTDKSKKVLGIVADFDIVQNIVAEGNNPAKTKVTQAMYTIAPVTLDTPVIEAFNRMQKLNVNVVPVIENDKLLGVATVQDCWSDLEDSAPTEDEVGFIEVANPKMAELWLTGIAVFLAFLFGVIFPLAGIFGFFKGAPADVGPLFGAADILGGEVTFYLFNAHGSNFFSSYFALMSRNGWWVISFIWSLVFLIVGLVGLFSLLYTAYADLNNTRTGDLVRWYLPGAVVVVMIIQWILFAIATGGATVTLDVGGFIFSLLAMILILVGIFRDLVFRQDPKAGKAAEVAK